MACFEALRDLHAFLLSSLPSALRCSHSLIHPFVHSCIYSTYILSVCHCIPGTEADSLTRPGPWCLYQWDGQAASPDPHGGGSDWHTERMGHVLWDPEEGGLLWAGSGSKGLVDKVHPAARCGREGELTMEMRKWRAVGEGIPGGRGASGPKAGNQDSPEQAE